MAKQRTLTRSWTAGKRRSARRTPCWWRSTGPSPRSKTPRSPARRRPPSPPPWAPPTPPLQQPLRAQPEQAPPPRLRAIPPIRSRARIGEVEVDGFDLRHHLGIELHVEGADVGLQLLH